MNSTLKSEIVFKVEVVSKKLSISIAMAQGPMLSHIYGSNVLHDITMAHGRFKTCMPNKIHKMNEKKKKKKQTQHKRRNRRTIE